MVFNVHDLQRWTDCFLQNEKDISKPWMKHSSFSKVLCLCIIKLLLSGRVKVCLKTTVVLPGSEFLKLLSACLL